MKITYQIAMAAGQDAGDASMKKHGRAAWNKADWDVAARLVTKLLGGEHIA